MTPTRTNERIFAMFINTHAIIKRLMEVGIQEQAAEIFVETVQKITATSYENLATKQDLLDCKNELNTTHEFVALRNELGEHKLSMEGQLTGQRISLEGQINELRLSLEGQINELRRSLEGQINELKLSLEKQLLEHKLSTEQEFKKIYLEISRLRSDIEKLSLTLTLRMGGMITAAMLFVTALQKFLGM